MECLVAVYRSAVASPGRTIRSNVSRRADWHKSGWKIQDPAERNRGCGTRPGGSLVGQVVFVFDICGKLQDKQSQSQFQCPLWQFCLFIVPVDTSARLWMFLQILENATPTPSAFGVSKLRPRHVTSRRKKLQLFE